MDLILYQAGADQHENDALDGFLNSVEMRDRDATVFDFACSQHIALVWNLAGGYKVIETAEMCSIQLVLNLHNARMEECIGRYRNTLAPSAKVCGRPIN